ncbi:MAG TPA: sulfurtransferase TusA family protein [Candidatus Dormibacteraeota bacterium]
MPETDLEEDTVLDCRGQLCPMPVVRTAGAVAALERGQVIKVMVTDRGALADVPAWAQDTGNTVLHWREERDHLVFYVRKEEAAPDD